MALRRRIPSAGPSITQKEIDAVTEAVRSGWYENCNLWVERFEAAFSEYLGGAHCLATTNCTSAIHLALLGLGIQPGDEVIVPDITWVASAAPVCYVGARPVFVDIDPVTWCMDAKVFEAAITPRTRAVIPVGLLGALPDMDRIREIAERHSLVVIEDAAESLGASYHGRKAGTLGDIGVFSFNGTKLLVTGEGGLIATRNPKLFERFRVLSHHGISREPGARYYWSTELGYKFKMSNLQAALGLAQLERIEELVLLRRRIFGWYAERLGEIDGITLAQEGEGVASTFWIVNAMIDPAFGRTKEELVATLAERGIDARPFFYPLSSMPPFAPYCGGRDMRRLNPVAYELSPYGLCLPSAFEVREDDVDYVCAALLELLGIKEPS